jgi:hypothetical protein
MYPLLRSGGRARPGIFSGRGGRKGKNIYFPGPGSGKRLLPGERTRAGAFFLRFLEKLKFFFPIKEMMWHILLMSSTKIFIKVFQERRTGRYGIHFKRKASLSLTHEFVVLAFSLERG